MKRFIILLSVTAMIFSFQEMQAQSLRDRVKKAIFNDGTEIKSKEDSTTIVTIEDPTESSSVRVSDKVMLKALGLTDNVPYEPEYSFDAHIQSEISNYKKDGKLDSEMMYDSYVHKTNADYAMEFSDNDAKSTIIFDSKNLAMLILGDNDGEKTGFATSIDPESFAEDMESSAEEVDTDVDTDVAPYNYKKTGKTKNILGYSCDEYLLEDEYSEVHAWISEKLGKEVRKEWLKNSQTFGAMFAQAYYLNGMVLEYDLFDKENGERTVMLVTKVDLNANHKISTKGYTIMSMRKKTEEE
jgi:hypothetical protein